MKTNLKSLHRDDLKARVRANPDRRYRLNESAPRWAWVRDKGEALATHFLRGTIVHHIPVMRSGNSKPAPREVIRDMSKKARGNAAFKFGNAERQGEAVEWCAMVVLTWHHAPPGIVMVENSKGETVPSNEVKRTLKKLARAWRKRFGEGIPAWIMEMQKRGVPHFHLFIPASSVFGAQCVANVAGGACESVERKGKTRCIVRGNLDRWLVREWLKASGQSDDADAVAFHEGGIIEMFESSDAAGRYVAKESSKREQKVLPERYADGLGRWWYLSKALKPIPKRRGFVSLDAWPFQKPFSRVWQTEALGKANFGSWDVERDGEASEAIAHWLRDTGQSVTCEELDATANAVIAEINRRERLCAEVDSMLSESDVAEDYSEAVASMHLSRLANAFKTAKHFRR